MAPRESTPPVRNLRKRCELKMQNENRDDAESLFHPPPQRSNHLKWQDAAMVKVWRQPGVMRHDLPEGEVLVFRRSNGAREPNRCRKRV
jgi:hypothetical protein